MAEHPDDLFEITVSPQSRLAGLTDTGVCHTLVMEYFRAAARGGGMRHLIDVGAAAGGIAEPFLRDGWSADLIEPDPAWHPPLERLAGSYRDRCRLYPVAIGPRDAEADFLRNAVPGLSGMHASPFGRTLGAIPVRTVRLDTFIADSGGRQVDFLKIDTEGTDFEILETFPYATQSPPLIFVEYSFYFPTQTPEVIRGAIARMESRRYAPIIFDYDDDGNFHRGNWRHRLVTIHAGGAIPQRSNSFGNLLFYRRQDPLLQLLRDLVVALS